MATKTLDEILEEIDENNLAAQVKSAIIARETGNGKRETGNGYKITTFEYSRLSYYNKHIPQQIICEQFSALFQNNTQNLHLVPVWYYGSKPRGYIYGMYKNGNNAMTLTINPRGQYFAPMMMLT